MIPRLYALTDLHLAGISHADQVALLCQAGVSFLQLREKRLSPREFYTQSLDAMLVARKYGALIIINDRCDIALSVGADGVHLGQEDLSPISARRLLGRKAIIGLSTHNLRQVDEAATLPINYIAFGPVFTTMSKDNADPEVGLEILRLARKTAHGLPLIAIGGITADNSSRVLESGADSLAMISALLAGGQSGIVSRTTEVLRTLESP